MSDLPLTVRRSIEVMGLFFLGWIVVLGDGLLAPLLMAFFISIMVLPLYRFFCKIRFPEALSIGISILALILVLGLVVWFFSSQIRDLVRDFPVIQRNVTNHLNDLSEWVGSISPYSTEEQLDLIREQSNRLLSYVGGLLSSAALSLTSVLVFLGLLPIYIFLLLFYKNLLLRFVFLWFQPKNHKRVRDALREMELIIKSYLFGLLIQVSYMTVLLGGILLIIGIKHALLIGLIFAFLNLIPYVGALLGNIIGVLITLASSAELWPIFVVLGTIAAVQFLDNNILMPRIVGSKVKINALAAIVGVLVGGEIAGIPGMFLSLPIIAVLKVIFDRSERFKQWGVLFGDERPEHSPMHYPVLRQKDCTVDNYLKRENNVEPPREDNKP
ncbi:putative PurR-regulated permease PerM [Pontibacter ummariensis]|uniref:Predicted PurR-regulated permease PerM n=1 Tax=Pontibacter ummariensis TaxID=1610492 RepID=A0A239D6U5_9BACT|nr:AI-2E family transporter [Pontibacter ummariensis]PRY14277.1 putative PurR-regulated permease PerM [Pontibacter ummariensis]SNS28007.1 Predicted PurR-regulated permease PerM [Pontibacter ummariensis]